jgi:hypothetical protein
MTPDTKRMTLACLVGLTILTAIMALALQRLELKPGVPLPAPANGVVESQSRQELSESPIPISDFWKAVVGLSSLVAIIYISYRLLRSATWSWWDAAKTLAYASVLFFLVACILWALLSGGNRGYELAAEPLPPPVVEQTGPPLGPLPSILIWLSGLGLAATLVGVGLWVIFRPAGRASTDRLTLQAEWALQALKMGLDLKNVIVRCYWQMGQVLQEEQGIEMKTTMTVREFERLLKDRGVPPLPVHQLTQLFEMARYGHRAASAEDERQAIDALTAIVQYSRVTKP